MKKILFLFLAFCGFSPLYSQSDSTRDFILDYKDVKTEIITKGRRLLISKLLQNDTTKTAEIVNYLLAQEDDNYVVFSAMERWLLYYWTGQYQKALADLPEQAVFRGRHYYNKLSPEPDNLLVKLHETLTAQQQVIIRQFTASDINEVDKDFHLLNMNYLLAGAPFRYHHNNDSLRQKAAAFLLSHPASPYETYIRRNLLHEVVYAHWGFAFEFFTGYGALTDKLQPHFKNPVPMGIAFDVGYKNWVLYLRNYIGFSRTRDTLLFTAGNWNKGLQARVFLPEASIGYAIVDSRRLKLAPFAGIGSMSIAPTEHDKTKNIVNENAELKFTTAFIAGLNVDFKLGNPDKFFTGTQAGKSYTFLRLRYGYSHPQFDRKYTGFSGSMHYITIGIGGFGRTIKRFY